MKTIWKKLLSGLLALVMVMSLFPTAAFAEPGESGEIHIEESDADGAVDPARPNGDTLRSADLSGNDDQDPSDPDDPDDPSDPDDPDDPDVPGYPYDPHEFGFADEGEDEEENEADTVEVEKPKPGYSFESDYWMVAGDPLADLEGPSDWAAMAAGYLHEGDWRRDLLRVAIDQIDYRESEENYVVNEAGARRHYTRYGAWYGQPYGNWCAIFVAWCLECAWIPASHMPRNANADYWLKELKKAEMNAEPESYTPLPGDFVFYDFDVDGQIDHMGIVESVDPARGVLFTIQGNYRGRVAKVEGALGDPCIAAYGILPEKPADYEGADAFSEESGAQDGDKTPAGLADNKLEKTVNGQHIIVSGPLPADAELSVVPIPAAAAAEIYTRQTGEYTRAEDMIFALDLSILSGGEKYDLEVFGEGVSVTITNVVVRGSEEGLLDLLHVKEDVTDGKGSLDNRKINQLKSAAAESERIDMDASDGELAFEITGCSTFIAKRGPAPGTLQYLINRASAAEDEAGRIVTLTKDYEENVGVPVVGNITLDLNGHTITVIDGAEPSTALTVDGTLTLIDSRGGGGIRGSRALSNTRGIMVVGTLVMEGGTVSGFTVAGSGGGVFVVRNARFIMNGGTISGNTAEDNGGGVFAVMTAGTVLGPRAVISGNHAANGGGIAYCYAGSSSIGGAQISGNSASNNGGGVYCTESVTLELRDALLSGNTAEDNGGGIYCAAGSTLTIDGTSITDNRSVLNGGGLWTGAKSSVTMDGSSVTDNEAGVYTAELMREGHGGGLYLDSTSTLSVRGSEISRNTAYPYGGGAYLGGSSTMELEDCTIVGNSVNRTAAGASSGGGFYLGANTGATLNDVEMAGNHATAGGGLFSVSGNSSSVTVNGGRFHDNFLDWETGTSAGAVIYMSAGGSLVVSAGEFYSNGSERTTTAGGAVYSAGAGIFVRGTMDGGTPSVVFRDNKAGSGAAIQNGGNNANHTIELENVDITNNTGSGTSGAVCCSTGKVLIHDNAVFRGNRANGGSSAGGAVYGGTVTVDGAARFESNYAVSGGAIYGSRVNLLGDGAVYEDNSAENGGAIHVPRRGAFTMSGGTIRNNTASSYGGGIYLLSCIAAVEEGGSSISGGTICGNTALAGGGIYASNQPDSGTRARLTISGGSILENECTGSGDDSIYSGGGVYIGVGCELIMTGGEIRNNRSNTRGGGIFVGSASHLSWTKQDAYGLDVQGGVIMDNTAATTGNDIAGWTFGAGLEEQKRIKLTLCKAAEMGEDGQFPEAVWYDEIEHEEHTEAVSGDDQIAAHQEAGDTAGFYYGYTFRYDLKAVAQIGSVNYFSLQAAFDAIGNDSATGTDVVLLCDTKECVILPEGIRATLNLKGFSVIGREKTVTTTDGEGNESSAVCGSVLVIPYGSSLTLRDTSDEQSGAITEGTGTPVKHGSATHRFGGGVLVGGEFVLESGNITNNKGDRGSGVFVNSGASFVMKGGSVSDNAEIGVCVRYATETEPDTAGVGPAVFRMESGEIRGNKNHGIYALGKSGEEPTLEISEGEIFENSTTGSGGVFLTAAELTLSGGKIRDNSATSGGGVYAENSVLTLSGGEIRGNRSTTGNGGGVSAKDSALTLSGTVFTDNSAPKGNGGGLHLTSGSFTMTGGEISGSLANHGAALYLNAVTGCEMTGGEIRENRAVYNGGGVYASGASCRLAGVTITDNVAGNCGGGVYSKSASLSFTDGEITGNRAVSRGGGVYFHEGAVGPTLRVDGGARLHGNEAGIASDLYTIANAKIEELIPAANMGTGHAVWYDEETKIAYTGSAEDMAALLGTQSGGCYQNAEEHFLRAGLNLNPEAAARIERDGLTHFYGSVFEAITDSRDGETVVVLKDVAESFTVPENRKDLTLNLNGYTITGMADATIVVGSGAQLKLVDEIETDGKQGGEGTLLPSPYESSARGVYLSGVNNVSRETRFELAGGTIKGFTNSGIYGESRAAVVISGGTIRDCSTSGNGGGVYLSNPSAFTMSGGTIRDCSALGSGGGVYVYLNGASYPLVITGGEVCGCEAAADGGGIYIDHPNNNVFSADVSGVHIHHNHAAGNAGGLMVRGNGAGSTAVYGLTVEYNSADTSTGGIYLGNNKTNRIGSPDVKTEVRYNSSKASVGGIAIANSSEPTLLENTDIHHNMAVSTVGLSMIGCKAIIRDVGIFDNTAYEDGVQNNGVAATLGTAYSSMELEFENVYIARNKTERGGGAMFYLGNYLNINKFQFKNCTFEDHGGSIFFSHNVYSSNMSFENCRFLNNRGSLFAHIYFNSSEVTFTDCEIGNNSYLINASYANGSTIDLNNTHIYGCTSTPVLFGSSDGSLNVLNVNDGTVFENNDGAIAGSGDVNIRSGARLINNASSGNGGAINKSGGTLNIEDGVEISGNSAKGSGGAVHLSGNASLNMPGGTITDNSAANGGAISLSGSAAASIGGGEIRGNSATNGGALYLGAGTETTVTGGFITDNRAVRLGGGVYVTDSGAAFTLSGDGKLYDNRAGFGQEAYFYWTAKTANPSRADLIKATEMFRAPDVREGISWWDEGLELHYENGFHFNFKREYGLMLLYKDPDRIVAKIDLDGTTYEFATVQSAMDFVRAYQLEEGKEDDRLTVRLVADDIHESVTVPGGVTATLDLNGHTLAGVTNALTVLGDLELEGILDPADPEAGDGPGTITGSSRGNGGGIMIQGSGRVVMKSGEIAGCEAAPVTGGKGGGVCVEGGSFELQGGSIHDNSSSYGGGVYVGPAGSFLMSGGEIRDNSVVGNTNYYNRVYGAGGGVCDDGGIAYISGGRITDNSASDYGGGVYLSSGGKTRFSFAGTSDDPVVLSGNTSANQGGGLYQAGGTASIEHVRINDNKAGLTVKETVTTADIGNAGGGLCLANGKTMIFGGVDVTRNEAARGGGIAICGNSTVTMVGGSVISNKAQLAGGIYQNPLSASSFSFNGGKLYANRSIRTSTGNDFYSFYEGADDYPGNRQKDMPIANLQSASRMGNENYNIWRDDRYDGANLSETYGEGRYISSAIPRSRNDLLTASSFTQDELPVARSDMKVSILAIKKIGGEETEKNAHLTGAAPFDTTAADKEVFARDLLGSGAAETDQTYLFNGREEHYISYNGKLYEQEQAVEWSPGDDASQYNTIVRTYDKVTYMLYIGAESVDNTPGAGSNTTVDQDGRKVYYYQIRGVLPCDESEAEFSLDTAASTNLKSWSVITQYVDGKPVQVLNATYEAKIGAEDQAFENTKNIYVTVRHMKNGDTFKPTFTAWIEGNEDNTDHPAACASKMLTVSAAGRYNLTLLSNNALSYTGYFDLETGQEAAQNEYYKPGQDHVVHGTMLGYGVTVEMYNNDPAKGIKGLELPTDELEFDLRMRGGLYLNGEPITDENGVQMTKAPYIWAYKENSFADTGRPLGAASIAVNMNWDDEDELAFPSRSANNAAPLNKSGGVAAGANSAYSGGNWLLLGNQPAAGDGETVMHIRLKGYAFDKMENANPTLSDNGTNGLPWSPGHVKAFSAGYIQVIFPFEKKDAQNQSGYLSIDMQAVVSDLEIERISGQEVYSTAEGILHDPAETPDPTQLERYFGAEAPAHATNEMLYSDNFVANSTGMYVSNGDGDATGDGIGAVNYYANAADAIMELETGKAATPLATERIYVGSRLIFSSKEYRTDDPENFPNQYIPDDVFDPAIHNKLEYNYLTALNLLQKYDPTAFHLSPTDKTRAVVGERFNLRTGRNEVNGFIISNSETETQWSNPRNSPYNATQSYTLTILYAAKPDGTAWNKQTYTEGDLAGKDDGGTADMRSYCEENLVYYTTLAELEADGKECVAILYELRDCCIRRQRSIRLDAPLTVTDDFSYTGNTYATTHEVRGWTTYRPEYKSAFPNNKDSLHLYSFDWADHPEMRLARGNTYIDLSIFGYDTTKVDNPAYYEAYYDNSVFPEMRTRFNYGNYEFPQYYKTQYRNGSQIGGTHNGSASGNSILLYTLTTSIRITNEDYETNEYSGVRATHYDVHHTRTASFKVWPAVDAASEVLRTGELKDEVNQYTNLTVTVTIPKGLTYEEGSFGMDFSDSGYEESDFWKMGTPVVHSDGTTTIVFNAFVRDVSLPLPQITYRTKIGDEWDVDKDVKNGDVLTSTASIYATYEEENVLAATIKTDRVAIHIVKNDGDAIYLGVEKTLTEINEQIGFTLNYQNYTREKLENIQLLDVLPYNGDGRGTEFHGGYRVEEIVMQFNDDASYEAYKNGGGKLRVLGGQHADAPFDTLYDNAEADGSVLAQRFDDATRSVVFTVPALTVLDSDSSAPSIRADLPEISSDMAARIFVRMSALDGSGELIENAEGQTRTGGDRYGDDFHFRVGSEGSILSSQQRQVNTVLRGVSGIVWLDMDRDGLITNADLGRRLRGVTVEVLMKNEAGEFVRGCDLLGNELVTTTNANGYYSFTNLGRGEIYIRFSAEGRSYHVGSSRLDGPIEFDRLSATTLIEDLGFTMTNRSVGNYGSGALQLRGMSGTKMHHANIYTTIAMPAPEKITSGRYIAGDWNCGLYYDTIRLEKEWSGVVGDLPDSVESVFTIVGRVDGSVVTDAFEYTLRGNGYEPLSDWTEFRSDGKSGKTSYHRTLDLVPVQAETEIGGVMRRIDYSVFEERASAPTRSFADPILSTAVDGETLVLRAENPMVLSWLEISKRVTGSLGNKNKLFTIKLTVADLGSCTVPTTGDLSEVVFVNGVAEIRLKHGQSVHIPLPANALYEVKEDVPLIYTASYETEGGTVTQNDPPKGRLPLDETSGVKVKVTNTAEMEIPTGVNLGLIAPIALVALSGGGILLLLAKRRKKR